ncbi:hypothetical protein PV11_04876 [Exophiala sideris]|uniref:Uncharacterized protein n=1 Tax=Exophiala sideris TaxID=1016849 RepID=A0A0D1YIT7_9EURO|nr:hypothetical protein PV11_04876 [Exophiala sideris]
MVTRRDFQTESQPQRYTVECRDVIRALRRSLQNEKSGYDELLDEYNLLRARLEATHRLEDDYSHLEARHERLLRRYDSLVDKHDRMVQKYESMGQDYDSLVQKYDRKVQKYESMGQDYDSLVQKYDRKVQKNDNLNKVYESLVQQHNRLVQENDRLDHSLQLLTTVMPGRLKQLEEERDNALARASAAEAYQAELLRDRSHPPSDKSTHLAGQNTTTDFREDPSDRCFFQPSRAASHHDPSVRNSETALNQSLSTMQLNDNNLKSRAVENSECPDRPLKDSRRASDTTSPTADSAAASAAPVEVPPRLSPAQPPMRPASPKARNNFSYQGRRGRRHGHGRGQRGGRTQNPAEVVRGHRPPWGQLH